MKKVFFLISFCLVTAFSFSQSFVSKLETENWILGKLKKNSICYTVTNEFGERNLPYYKNLSFKIDGQYLIITYVRVERKDLKVTEFKLFDKVPISEIDTLTRENDSYPTIVIKTITNSIIIKDTNGDESYSKQTHFGFNFNDEANLLERLNKAFKNLKRFYPKSKSTEPF